ncbi:aldehyde dehydrogenase family protein [Dechloromonas sp. ARDL1]|uniref:aldehyde dehydrogenase family protein n=1 Tax=Dechloromonas sp. ARDL1 TaxID=3322121 RepID=UPI003DA720B5
MHKHDQLYIDGRWVSPASPRRIAVINPYTEQPVGHVPDADSGDADSAVEAARRAFPVWSATSVDERVALLKRCHEIFTAKRDAFTATLVSEVGMPAKLTRRIQVGLPMQQFDIFADLLPTALAERQIGHSRVLREPIGVVACITPWNYPLHQIVAKVVPAIVAGCTVVLKPSEVAPLNAFLLAEVFDEAGLPPGVFNLVTGYGASVGQRLVSHPDVDMVSFTGSTAAGRAIGQAASATIKRVALELGGKSAAVVLDDADLPTAVRATVSSCFLNSGQTCTALTRLVVPHSRYEEAARLAVEAAERFTLGDPNDDATRLGPLVSRAQQERVHALIRRGIASGAELLLGGAEAPLPARGYFCLPTVFGRVAPGSVLDQEEIFGPVLSILTYPDGDDAAALAIANGTIYGLAGAVWSQDAGRAARVAGKMRAGQIDINGAAFNIRAPFGGFRQSGNGREMGIYGIEEFTELKAIQMPAS